MKITQELVDKIIAKAKASDYGLSDGLTHKQDHLQISAYARADTDALAMLLVNGYDDKYDLISVFTAAFKLLVPDEAHQAPHDQISLATTNLGPSKNLPCNYVTVVGKVRDNEA